MIVKNVKEYIRPLYSAATLHDLSSSRTSYYYNIKKIIKQSLKIKSVSTISVKIPPSRSHVLRDAELLGWQVIHKGRIPNLFEKGKIRRQLRAA